jgi:hypothetical protein
MLQQMVESVGQGPDGPADSKVSKSPFAQGPKENAMTGDKERVFMISSGHKGYQSERTSKTY